MPSKTRLVSSDSHWFLYDDIFYERAPDRLKDRMPRIWTDETNGYSYIGVGFQKFLTGIFDPILHSLDRAGAHDVNARLQDLDDDGVEMEILFPQWLMYYLHQPDLEAREWIFRIYNEYLAELCEQSNGRLFGVGIPNYWDPLQARASILHIRDLGLRTYILPINPGKDANGVPVVYASDTMAPLWAAAEEVGLPVNFHVGESATNLEGPGGVGVTVMETFTPFRRSLGQLIFGGILDRHPTLRVVFSEAGINWVPGALQDAELAADGWGKLMQPKIKMRPTEYWAKHCYATFMADEIGLKLIDYIGADRVMWSTDYPHNEGSHGYVGETIRQVVEAVSADEARMILGGTAIELFNLPRNGRRHIADPSVASDAL
ncbi:MAG: amidohydrolase [Alphaproteobacteria bacterium]|nr:amidohydrolase [Alphaproteobacteria bacterium]